MTIKTLKARLIEASKQQNTALHIIEQDYILSWVLSCIAKHPILARALVFKGGTCLKKCYFGDYRFSQDLDFTIIESIDDKTLYSYVDEVCKLATQELNDCGQNVTILCNEYQLNKPHPFGQNAYSINVRLAWHKMPLVRVLIEITRDEVVITPIQKKTIIHGYGEVMTTEVQVYCLEEIIMEKLRAILQQIVKMHERGWGRSRARDFYDLWMIFNKYGDSINLDMIKKNISKKFQIKNVKFNKIDDFYDQKYIEELVRTWHQWLNPFVKNLPDVHVVLEDVRCNILPKIFKS